MGLNRLGLIFGIIGVVIIFIWGPPQPDHSSGVGIALEDATYIQKEGKTVEQINDQVKMRKVCYRIMSNIGLALILLGFALQLWSTWLPIKKDSKINKKKNTHKKSN